MASYSTTKLQLLISVLVICDLIDSSGALRIVRIKVSGKGAEKTNITTSYDLPAGCTIIVECDEPSQILRYDTDPLAQEKRFDNGTRVIIKTNNRWKLSHLTTNDTGLLTCYSKSSNSGSNYSSSIVSSSDNGSSLMSSLYIFVNGDEENSLFVPIVEQIFFKFFLGSYFPCLPTYSQTNVTLRLGPDDLNQYENLTEGVDYIYDNQRGVKLLRIHRTGGANYNCVFSHNERVENTTFFFYIVDLDILPEPTFAPVGGKHHYLIGQNLTLMCSILFEDIQFVVYKYPASNCPYDATDALGCDKLRNTSRVTMTELLRTKGNNKNLTSTINIQNLQLLDSGEYVCQYKIFGDDKYRRFSSQTIHVVKSPLINVTTEQEVVTGVEYDESLSLTAKVEALVKPLISWSFNSAEINSSTKYNMSSVQIDEAWYKIQLKIRTLSLSDAGGYTMAASIGSKTLRQEFAVKVNAPPQLSMLYAYRNQTIPLSEEVQTVYFQSNHILNMNCKTVGGTPQPHISWSWQDCDHQRACVLKNGPWKLLPNTLNQPARDIANHPYFQSVNPASEKLRLTTLKSGWLRCSGSNAVGGTDLSLRIAISELPEEYGGIGFSKTTMKLADQLVEGDVMVLRCYVSKFSCTAEKVQINRSNNEIYDKKSLGLLDWTMIDGTYKISISLNATLDTNGYNYTCGCKDGRYGPQVTLSVRSYVAPSWVTNLQDETEIKNGQTYTLMCRATGTPLPTVKWYRDGQLLRASDTTLLSEDRYNLTLVRAKVSDSGRYSCKAEVLGRENAFIESYSTLTIAEEIKISDTHITIITIIAVVTCLTTVIVSSLVVRKFCRRKYVPHILLLPSKDSINPAIPLDEQTDALPYDTRWEFPVGNLKLGMLLGQGAFGRVLKAEAMHIEEGVSSTTVAVKTVRDQNDMKQIKSLISELKILIHVGQHLNIVNLLGACTKRITKGHILLIVEYCQYGNLRSYLLKHKPNFIPTLPSTCDVKLQHFNLICTGDDDYLNERPSELHSVDKPVSLKDILSWCYQIARGMEYLASIDYIHRDLAARNVLLADDNIVKICDFGLSKDVYKYQEYQKQTEGPLPVKWMALECLTHKVFNVRTDVWSYGVTVWELFSLAATPYPGWEMDETFIGKLQDGYRMEKPEYCPKGIYENVLLKCWSADPEKRPNFASLADLMSEQLETSLIQRLRNLEKPYLIIRDCNRQRKRSMRQDNENNVTDQIEIEYSALMLEKSSKRRSPATNKYHHVNSVQTFEKFKDTDDDCIEIPSGRAPSAPTTLSTVSTLTGLRLYSSTSENSSPNSSPGIVNAPGPPSYNYVMDSPSTSTYSPTTPLYPKHETTTTSLVPGEHDGMFFYNYNSTPPSSIHPSTRPLTPGSSSPLLPPADYYAEPCVSINNNKGKFPSYDSHNCHIYNTCM